MITKSSTITFDGQTKEEYDQIVEKLEIEVPKTQGWKLTKDPLTHRVTATKKEEIAQI